VRRRFHPLAGAVPLLTLLVAGCQLGERPTLGPEQSVTTGDAATDAVLERLDATPTRAFSAEYSIVTPTGEDTTATVVSDGNGGRTITVGSTRYLVSGTASETCDTIDGNCSAGLDPQPISSYGISPDFYGTSAANRLRRDAGIRVGPTTASDETVAGQDASCVTVPIEDTASVFCALEDGPLARWRSTDITIELTAFSPA